MNLLLLEADELAGDGNARLGGRRARHAAEVLRVIPGQELRIGVLDGPLGTGTVTATSADRLELACRLDPEPPAAGPQDVLLLAVARPKVLARCLEHATALGFARIVLLRTWHVDRSHFGSKVLEPQHLRAHLLAGLEQSCRTRLPTVRIEPLFKPFVEDRLDEILRDVEHRFVGHPGDGTAHGDLPSGSAPLALAIGPERGFTEYELEALTTRSFARATLGPHPLRVETALAALTGRLTARR